MDDIYNLDDYFTKNIYGIKIKKIFLLRNIGIDDEFQQNNQIEMEFFKDESFQEYTDNCGINKLKNYIDNVIMEFFQKDVDKIVLNIKESLINLNNDLMEIENITNESYLIMKHTTITKDITRDCNNYFFGEKNINGVKTKEEIIIDINKLMNGIENCRLNKIIFNRIKMATKISNGLYENYYMDNISYEKICKILYDENEIYIDMINHIITKNQEMYNYTIDVLRKICNGQKNKNKNYENGYWNHLEEMIIQQIDYKYFYKYFDDYLKIIKINDNFGHEGKKSVISFNSPKIKKVKKTIMKEGKKRIINKNEEEQEMVSEIKDDVAYDYETYQQHTDKLLENRINSLWDSRMKVLAYTIPKIYCYCLFENTIKNIKNTLENKELLKKMISKMVNYDDLNNKRKKYKRTINLYKDLLNILSNNKNLNIGKDNENL